eukprot:5710837-Pleurochrysis_carterae.AAC.1
MRHGFRGDDDPRLNGLSDWQNTSLFVLACHFQPLELLGEMAAVMTTEGAEKAAAGMSGYGGWNVTLDDLLQWIGVWRYMLAFPQGGERSKYWEEPKGGFGPRHCLSEYLRIGQSGEGVKGRKWFAQMHAYGRYPNGQRMKKH